MKEFNKNNVNPIGDEEKIEEAFTIPDETSCSSEFPEGCVSPD